MGYRLTHWHSVSCYGAHISNIEIRTLYFFD